MTPSLRLASLLLVAAALLLPVAGQADWRSQTRYVAIVIGTNDYEDSVRKPLSWAAKDARDLAAVLRDPDHGAFDEVIELHDEATPATRTNVWAALDDLRRLGRNDVVLVFFAGHGVVRLGETGRLEHYLVLSDTQESLLGSDRRRDVESTTLSVEALNHFLTRKVAAEGKVVVIDACHQLEDQRVRQSVRSSETTSPYRYTLQMMSAGEGYNAQESDTLENGVFTHFLVEALEGGRPDAKYSELVSDGSVSALEAFIYAGAETLDFTNNDQVPMRVEESFAGAPVVLAGARDGRTPSRVLLASGALGRDLRLRGGTIRIRGEEGSERNTPVGEPIIVTPGTYEVVVERANGRRACSGTYRLASAEVELENLCAAPTLDRRLAGLEVGLQGTAPVGSTIPLLPPVAADLRGFVGRSFGPIEPRLTLGLLLGPPPRPSTATIDWPPSLRFHGDVSALVHFGRRGHAAFVGPLGQVRLAVGGVQSRPSLVPGVGVRGGWVMAQRGQRLVGVVGDVTLSPLGASKGDRSWHLGFGARLVIGMGR